MKKIKLLAYALTASFTLLACRDAVDIVQDGELTQEVALRSVSDLQGFLYGNVYGALDTSNEIWLTSVFTDETGIAPSNSGWYFSEFRYILSSDNEYVAGAWGSNYRAINRANRVLETSANITPTSADETLRFKSILAQARAVRALSYLNLLSYFTTNMADDNALGVILVTDVPDLNAQLPRATNGAVYSQIEADLDYAYANLWESDPKGPAAGVKYKFVTKNMINAIRARMYTYRGNYPQAKIYAQDVIANGPALLPAANNTATNPYRAMWADVTQGETIFALSRPSSGTWGDIARFWTTNSTDINGAPLLKIGMKQYALWNKDYDIRSVAFVDDTSTGNIQILNKYPGKGNTALRNDIKVFRTSEMYLIKAEAEAAAGNFVAAATIIKDIRTARRFLNVTIPMPSYANKAEALRDILKERRTELSFEGHRYVDLRRLGAQAGVTNDRSPLDDGGARLNAPLSLPITDYRWTFPIPSAEKLGNPSIVQNPGY